MVSAWPTSSAGARSRPTEILDETLARIEARNPAINAVVTRMDEQARAALAAGLPAGPFTGVPYLLKDLGALYTGVVTSYGGTLFADNVADHDSELTLRLKRAGLVIVGKSNTPEMGLAPSTEPRRFGPTRNPWNLDYSAGGSSGGAAAAVAAGILPMAHATDGGGSIRIPASCCGLFGLKPTRARNPMGPDAGEGWGGASIGHAVTWSVRDSAALLDATSGPDVGDPYWAPPPAGPVPGRGRPRSRPAAHRAHRDAVDQPHRSIRSARRPPTPRPSCARASATPSRRRGPSIDEKTWRQATRVIVAANITFNLEARAAALGRPLAEGDVERMTWDRVLDARTMTAAQYAGLDRRRAPRGPRRGALLPGLRRDPLADHVRAAAATRRARHVDRRIRTATWPRCSPASASPRCSTRPAIPP